MSRRIGILYPGGLGATFGRAIRQAGGLPLTCVFGRSEATVNRATDTGFTILPSLGELVSNCDVLISLVVPGAAPKVAESLCSAVLASRQAGMTRRDKIFIDANSIGPAGKERICALVSSIGIKSVGAACFGPINQVGPDNVLALSGPAANEAAAYLEPIFQVEVVGSQVRDASELKMSMAIITKALPALFLEMTCASAAGGHLGSLLALMRRLYPGIFSFLKRTIPTYPRQLERRVQELNEVIDWLDQQRQESAMTRSARSIFQRLRGSDLTQRDDWQFEDLLSEIADTKLLTGT